MKSKILFLLLLMPFCLLAQEFDCFNQIDDDGDGLIDIADPDCSCYLFNAVGNSQLTTTPPVGNTGQYCFDITDAANDQLGAIWILDKIDLNFDFAFRAEIYAGNNDGGADGFAIVFHNDPDGINALGGGGVDLGFGGYLPFGGPFDPLLAISPSIGFEIDTYDNGVSMGDVYDDHIAISLNGDVYNSISTPATTALPNIEDDNYHDVLIQWNSATQTFFFEIDGVYSTSYTGDVINSVFSGDNLVNFGFTGSTGGFNNRQTICITGFDLPSAGDSSIFQLCNGTPETFDLFDQLGGAPVTDGEWTGPNGAAFGTSHIGGFDLNTDQVGTYTYTVENGSGCVSPFATVEVRMSTSNFIMEAVSASDCDLVDGSIIFTNLHPNTNYEINYDVDGTSASSVNFTSDASGNYTLVNLGSGAYENIILTNDACDSDSQSIRVNESCIIPSGISPNNDGINDCFDVEWLQATNIQIFNRYGTQVYESNNYRNEWCGGTEDGQGGDELPTGTYYYVIEVSAASPITGWVYINRGN